MSIRDPIYDGARKKLWDAVGCLIATGPIEMRLTYATGHLIHLAPSQIPPSIADEFTNHMVTILWDEAELGKAENALAATIRATLRAEAKQGD
jgi:hypothetical protein